jgi:uncharacterized protein YoxC
MEDPVKTLLDICEAKKEKINTIASAINFSQSGVKTTSQIQPDGSTKEITKNVTKEGKNIFSVSKDGKNVMQFTSEKLAKEFLDK